VAVFDTAFHRTIPDEASTYALPAEWRRSWGIRRFGFHGLSVQWSTRRACELLERDAEGLRLVICHLGGGCSVTAVRNGHSVDTTMGFSPLEGIPMATRSGSVDPTIVLYALRRHGLDVGLVDAVLNLESGLKGLAGMEGMKAVEAAAARGDRDAALALDVFVHRLAGSIAAMATAAGGLDAVVFTAGVGENSSEVRSRATARLAFLGVRIADDLNAAAEPDCNIAAAGSDIPVLVIRAREELVAAEAARAVLSVRE
jgi:acetate kinase